MAIDSRKQSDKPISRMVRREVARRAQEAALASLPAAERRTTNLYIDLRVLERGETLGPKFDPIDIEQPSVLCFVDSEPRSNYSHNCRYLLFDAESGRPLKRIRARFPPYEIESRRTMRLFHEPVPVAPLPLSRESDSPAPCPPLPPAGRRFAILFAGVAQPHHANDLELCYRLLTGPYGFAANDVFVLCHSGVAEKGSGPFSDGKGALRSWVDGSDFTLQLHGAGTKEALDAVFAMLQGTMAADDMLFIHMDGHGGCDPFPDADARADKGSFLCTWAADNPIGGKYFSSQLEAHLASIGKTYRSLLVLAQQCHGGGFKEDVLAGSTALETSICCAAEKAGLSYWSADRNFNNFALDWLSAQRRQRPSGVTLSPDTNGSGAIEADEAYAYATLNPDKRDSPNYASQPADADEHIALSDPSPLAADWCALVAPMVNAYRTTQSETLYYQHLHRALPELRQMVLPVLKMHAGAIRKELVPRIERILSEAFGGKPLRPEGPPAEEKKQA